MSAAKVIEIVSTSAKSFEDAVTQGVAIASKSVRGIHGVDVTHWTAKVQENKISEYKVTLKIAFGIEAS